MAVTIDIDRRTIDASVRDLLGEPEKRSIGITGTGMSRMWIGTEIHRRVQEELAATEPGFRAEVPARIDFDVEGWRVTISGRADGVVFDGERAVRIDEIKSLHFSVDLHHLYAQERLDRFRRQVALYAFMLSDDEHPAVARLIVVDIVSHEERDEEIQWSRAEIGEWLHQQVHRLVAAERRRLDHLERLRTIADEIPFPHPEKRPVQITIGEAVDAALADSRHLLLRAPTGSGKTAAVLHAAIRGALRHGHRVFLLTSKTLQQRIAVETTMAMQRGLFRSLQLRAKSKMCANAEIICHEEYCPYAREYGIKLVRTALLKRLLDDSAHQDPDTLFEVARNHEVCPFEVSLDLLPDIDVVVCDYNYVFDPTIGLRALLHDGALQNAVLIIDEAHNLVDRSREYFSPTLDTQMIDRARAFIAARKNAVFDELSILIDELESEIRKRIEESLGDEAIGAGEAFLDERTISELRMAFDGAMLQYFLFKRETELWIADDAILDLFFALTRFHRVLGLGGDEFIQLAIRGSDRVETLKIFCRDASRFVGEILDESAATVAMSATLEPFEFYRDLLGFDPHRTDELYVPSPFPEENRLVLAIGDVDTTFRRRSAHYDGIAGWIAQLAYPDGNALALFPSYAFLDAVHERLPALGHTVIAQQPGVSDAEQRQVLEALGNGSPHLLMAVLGGIFAEGVDYPGAMLSQVIVVSPGLPQFNLERELLKSYYQERYEHGFAYAYLVPGLTRVVQAAGRLLRSETDRGVIVLLGKRFLDPRYARLLPEEWTEGDPHRLVADDPTGAIARFFHAATTGRRG